jgi:type I restriction enzyme, S subunit
VKAGWEVKALGEVATVTKRQGGSRPLAYVGLEDISSGGTGQFLGSFEPQSDKSTTFEFEPRHLLYGRLRPYLNKVLLPEYVGHCSSEIFPILPSAQLDRRFLFYWITNQTIVDAINETCTGARMPRANVADIFTFSIALPPLAEQKQIVAVLDSAFEGLARARANTEANLQAARELFDAAVSAIFDLEVQSGDVAPLESVTVLITKGSSPKWQGVSYVDEPGVLFVTSENVGTNEILLDAPKYVDAAFNLKDRKSILRNGDVLTNIVGASIGRTAVFERDDVANINQAVCMMRCRQGMLLNHFLAYLLNSPFFKQQLHAAEVDNARANLSLTFFRELKIPLPTFGRQQVIVEQIHGLIAICRDLQSYYRAKLADLDDLRQSLLQKAFAGELT